MNSRGIRSRCSVNTNKEADTFVGIWCDNGDISVNFPLGYRLAEDDKGVRNDIRLLLSTLTKYTDRKESGILNGINTYDKVQFPVQAYMDIISDYMLRGYYEEREVTYSESSRGKVDWNRTIKRQSPYMQGTDIFYLKFITKRTSVNEDKIITDIHKYCVYESFEKMGWLFTNAMPPESPVVFNYKLFVAVLRGKIACTNNDKNRMLFRNMLAIMEYEGDKAAKINYQYGTYRFEYVWERMIDRVYGVLDKSYYFPRTFWKIGGNIHMNAYLQPDTIMVLGDCVFILDAKYYKYGITGKMTDLPDSSSINKQITYGEYVAEAEKFKEKHGDNLKVYNAFLMPFNADENTDFFCIGQAGSDWKIGRKTYERVLGILIDTKVLMKKSIPQDHTEIEKLAAIIEQEVR